MTPTRTRFDVAVVGAGILGLAVARELQSRHPGAQIVVLDKEGSVGAHQTGRASGVVHRGVYYAPGSLKARLCVAGAARLLAYCDERGIPASSLFGWKRKLRGGAEQTPRASGFVEARVRGAVGVGGEVAVELASGRRIIVGGGFDRQVLLEVIDALEARGAQA